MTGTSSNGTAIPEQPRDWFVILGMAVSATSAAVSSFSGLRSLAEVAGWAPWMAPLLPATVDAFAATATRIWIATSLTSPKLRRLSRTCAVSAILLSLAGNAVWHLIAAHLVSVNWVIVLAVGTTPALVLGLVSHLAALRRVRLPAPVDNERRTDVPGGATRYGSVPNESGLPTGSPDSGPAAPKPERQARDTPLSDEEALVAARDADAVHRQAHAGHPISRDALRAALRISGARATLLLRQLRAETNPPIRPTEPNEKGDLSE